MKNTNFIASLKAFFSKAWTATKAFSIKAGKWVVANKLISIPVAVVLVGGIACAIALPIALHEHDFATEWSTDANNHWHSAICSHEEEKSDLGAHAYDNACDTTCNVCGATRTVGAHAYDNACDTTCNTCGAIRTVGAHAYDNDCDTTCNTCGATRTVGAHVYDNACDTTCNTCGATRTITHDHADTLTAGDTTHYYLCSVCGDKKDEVAHVFDKTVASSEYLKAAATATTKAQYYKSCVCGKASATEYFETDKAPANLQVADISKTYDGTPASEPTVMFDGVGAENFAYYKGNEKLTERPTDAGTYKVVVTVDETETHAGDRVEREFTIAKKVLSNLSVDLTYAGTNSFEVPLGSANGILADDVADGIKVCITFANKDVGAAVTGAGLDADDGDNYTNYELDLTTCTASIVPKVLTNISLVNTMYKGSTNFAFALSAYHGLVSGESFLLQVTTASKNVGNAVEITSISYANNNYSLDKSEITLNIVPKVLYNITYSFTYDGSDYQQVVLTSANHSGILGSDQVTLEVCFVDSIVGAAVDTSSPEMAPMFIDDNYVLGENYSFSIVPKKLTLKEGEKIEVTETYNGLKQYAFSVNSNRFDGYVDTEAASLMLTATLPSKNAGEYTDDVILTPYVGNSAFGTVSHNYDFSEVAATVTIKPLTVSLSSYVKVEYNGTSEFTLATPFDLTSANTGGVQDSVSDNDEVYITWIETDSADITDETFAIDYTLGGADAGNYDIDELGVEITKKKLTNLHLYITSDTYESGEITLLEKDGVVAGEEVKISITNLNYQDFGAGFDIFMELADGTSPDAYRYETIALVASGDYANYELATYDDGSGNQVVGIVEGI